MDDTEIIKALRRGGREEEEAAMRHIWYQNPYQACAKRALRRHQNVRLSSWEDVFHESLIKLIKQVKQGKYQEGKSLLAYFRGICNFTCLEMGRNENKESEWPELELPPKRIEELQTPLRIALRSDLKSTLRDAVEQLGTSCEEVLDLWSQGYSGDEIASLTGLRNSDTVKATVYRCLKKLRALLRQNTYLATILKELRWI